MKQQQEPRSGAAYEVIHPGRCCLSLELPPHSALGEVHRPFSAKNDALLSFQAERAGQGGSVHYTPDRQPSRKPRRVDFPWLLTPPCLRMLFLEWESGQERGAGRGTQKEPGDEDGSGRLLGARRGDLEEECVALAGEGLWFALFSGLRQPR